MKAIIGKNIRRLRENAGFTQKNLASFLGVDQSLIAKVEKGERNLSVVLIEKLASLFGVTIEQMESVDLVESSLSFAFRGNEFDDTEMEAISAINKIALNSELMRKLLKENESR